jgi:hypothetical protein
VRPRRRGSAFPPARLLDSGWRGWWATADVKQNSVRSDSGVPMPARFDLRSVSSRSLFLLALALTLSTGWLARAEVTLAPHQQAALDEILASIDPQARAMMRDQLARTLSVMNEQQVSMMLAAMEAGSDDRDAEPTSSAAAGDDPPIADEADLAFNRNQYEPAIRSAWQAQKAFDDFVDATLHTACPPNGAFAVWGSGWRYELAPLTPNWPRASDDADLDVQILGSSYAPQDGRYEFDFSALSSSFDRSAVQTAISQACADYRAIGDRFMADARRGIQGDYLPNGFELEGAANARVEPVRTHLSEALASLAPGGTVALVQILLGGKRID